MSDIGLKRAIERLHEVSGDQRRIPWFSDLQILTNFIGMI